MKFFKANTYKYLVITSLLTLTGCSSDPDIHYIGYYPTEETTYPAEETTEDVSLDNSNSHESLSPQNIEIIRVVVNLENIKTFIREANSFLQFVVNRVINDARIHCTKNQLSDKYNESRKQLNTFNVQFMIFLESLESNDHPNFLNDARGKMRIIGQELRQLSNHTNQCLHENRYHLEEV